MKKIGRKAGADRAPVVAITLKRELPVAIERAFHAWTSSRLLARWLVPDGCILSSVIVDPRKGGRYRIEGLLAEGAAFSISGTYLSVDAPTKLTMSWSYDGPPGPLQDEASIITVDLVARRPELTGITVTHEPARSARGGNRTSTAWLRCAPRNNGDDRVNQVDPLEGRASQISPGRSISS